MGTLKIIEHCYLLILISVRFKVLSVVVRADYVVNDIWTADEPNFYAMPLPAHTSK